MLSLLGVMRKKTARKILPNEILGARSAKKEGFLSDFVVVPPYCPRGHFFLAVFFGIMHNGLDLQRDYS